MDSHYLQQQRFLLQKRFRRLNSVKDYRFFHSQLVQFWNFLHSEPLFEGIVARLDAEGETYEEELDGMLTGDTLSGFSTEKELAEFCFRVVQHCAAQPLGPKHPELNIGRLLHNSSEPEGALEGFIEHFVEPLYEFIDESLDGQAAVLSLLIKYKKRAEWFERERLHALVQDGERELATDLYAYLFDQGLDFHIEPQSASGMADLVSPELVLDAKIFSGESSRGKRSITSGFNQLLTYTRDFHQGVGYLVIYRICPEDLQFEFATSDMLVPFLCVGGKTLYLLVIDICDHKSSASKRGPLKAHTISARAMHEAIAEVGLMDSAEAVANETIPLRAGDGPAGS